MNEKQEKGWDEALRNLLRDITHNLGDVLTERKCDLRRYVEQQWREMSTETFSKFMKEVHRHIFKLVNSASCNDKITAIVAIDELLDIDYDDAAGRHTIQFANYLRSGLTTNDQTVILMASKTLGRLVKKEGSLTADCVEFEVKRSLEWLDGDRYDSSRRHAAVLVLKEMAENAPTLFYFHVNVFFDVVWSALRDKQLTIRECGVQALSSTLLLVALREHRLRMQWYQKIWQETLHGFKIGTVEGIHGSLLTVGELLRHAGSYMADKDKEVCGLVLKYREHREKLIRATVVALLPMLASHSPKMFVSNYLNLCMTYLFQMLKKDAARSSAFLALGRIAISVGESIQPYLSVIVQQIKTALTVNQARSYRRTQPQICHTAITCVSMLAQAVGPGLSVHMEGLLPLIFVDGISVTLTEALAVLGTTIPEWLPAIQHRLLDLITMVLANEPFVPAGAPAPQSHHIMDKQGPQFSSLSDASELSANEKISLALKTLGQFDFKSYHLLDLVRDCALNYLDHPSPAIRTEAVKTCAKLMVQPIGRADAGANDLSLKIELKPADESEPAKRFLAQTGQGKFAIEISLTSKTFLTLTLYRYRRCGLNRYCGHRRDFLLSAADGCGRPVICAHLRLRGYDDVPRTREVVRCRYCRS